MFLNPNSTFCHSPLQYHYNRRAAIVEKREHMFLRTMSKAMRYYRVWIYACNVALFLGTLIYLVAFLTVISDTKLIFFRNIRLYQPSFVYCYLAILVQGGILQTIGCVGAIKLSERYLNIYLLTIVILLFGDGILGIVWILRYNSIITNLRFDLKQQLNLNYKSDLYLQELWNDLQANSKCCGVDGPADFVNTSWVADQTPPPHYGNVTLVSAESVSTANYESLLHLVPISCCHPEESTFGIAHTTCLTKLDNEHIWKTGCYDHLYKWLQSSVDLLSVLGFCVITFIKMCFLCLLRYEIKEMIDKIKVIKGQTNEPNATLPFQDLEAYLPRPSVQQDTGLLATTGSASQCSYRGNAITEKCHCKLGTGLGSTISNTLSGSRMILSCSSANLSDCQMKKHSIV